MIKISTILGVLRRRLDNTPGRALHVEPEMLCIQEILVQKRALILASVPYRQSPLRAVAPSIESYVVKLAGRLTFDKADPRACVNRAVSELITTLCDLYGMEPTGKKATIGHSGYGRGRVFRLRPRLNT